MWRIYYDDGVTFGSSQGAPSDAPGYGVQCIAQPNETLVDGHWYLYRSDLGQWIPIHTLDGLLDQFVTYCRQLDAVLCGRQTSRAKWHEAATRMNDGHR